MTFEKRYRDRSNWCPGPWDDEPDFVMWIDENTKYICMASRHLCGGWRGYIGITKSNFWWGRESKYFSQYGSVHGGITRGETEIELMEDITLKEDFLAGKAYYEITTDEYYWMCFDCLHYTDQVPHDRDNKLAFFATMEKIFGLNTSLV